MMEVIREAESRDADSINQIANWYIENTAVNFDTAAWNLEKRTEWLETFNLPGSPYKLLVYESGSEVIGFACNTRFRPKAAYDSTTETTVYFAHNIKSKGRGGKLYEALLDQVQLLGFHRACAVITLPNPGSVVLHQRLGFDLVGTFDEVGRKFDQYHSVSMYQKQIHQS